MFGLPKEVDILSSMSLEALVSIVRLVLLGPSSGF